MTKRDSVFAGIDSPRVPRACNVANSTSNGHPEAALLLQMMRQRRPPQWAIHGNRPQDPHHGLGMDASGMTSNAHHFGYTSVTPPVPLQDGSTSYPQGEAYPLQTEIQQQHRVLHTHIFKEVVSPHQTGYPNSLMVTEVDRWGFQRNHQPEFFFNGIVGHVRADNDGNIDSWEQATQLANYWRCHFNIPEVHGENASWHTFQQPSDNADRQSSDQEVPAASEMDDNESITANIGTLPIPSQIHQLATVLHNILNSDRESNAAILEKLENPQDDLSASPIQVFTAADFTLPAIWHIRRKS